MLRVAIVGCGKIADAHAAQIRRIGGVQIVAACDREPLMARQLAERFQVEGQFTDVDRLLMDSKPDVVHITTPPASHFDLARACLSKGSHVYVEKPFTLDASDAEAILKLAASRGLKVTAGHDDQFSHAARRMRALVNGGFLGGPVVHMESYYSYDMTDPGYARAFLSDRNHWVRQLPGQLLQNIISHGIARIAEYLESDSPEVTALGFTSPRMRQLGETSLVDELRVIISEEGRTAYFTFSSQMRPALHQFRIYGPKNGLALDQDQETVVRLPGHRFKSYAEKFIPPILAAREQLENVMANARTFLARDFHMKSGMKHLIETFYQSITDGAPAPIRDREILLTAKIMDAIFDQIDQSGTAAAGVYRLPQSRVATR